MMREHKHIATCPCCGRLHEVAREINDPNPPKPGDVFICVRCGDVSLLDAELKPRKISMDEQFAMVMSGTWALVESAQKALASEKAMMRARR
jgi:hypothetical protein